MTSGLACDDQIRLRLEEKTGYKIRHNRGITREATAASM
jgi:hypothetical protein